MSHYPDGRRPDDIQGCAPIVWTVLVGVIILTLATAMAKCSADEWTGPDKTAHFLVGGTAGGLVYLAARDSQPPRRSLAISLGVVTALAVGKELYDATGQGDPSVKDAAATLLGGLAVTVPLHALDVTFVANINGNRRSIGLIARF